MKSKAAFASVIRYSCGPEVCEPEIEWQTESAVMWLPNRGAVMLKWDIVSGSDMDHWLYVVVKAFAIQCNYIVHFLQILPVMVEMFFSDKTRM